MKKTLWIGLVLVLIFMSSQIFASTMSELEKQKEDIEAAFEETQAGLANAREQLTVANENIKNLELDILEIGQDIEDLEGQVALKQEEIQSIRDQIVVIEEKQVELYEQAKTRIRVMYEYGSAGYLEVLLDSKDLVDLFSRMEYINRLVEFDQNLFTELDDIKSEVERQEVQLEIQESQLNHMTAEATLQKKQLENKVVSKNLEVANILEDQELYNQRMDELEEEEARVDEEIKELIRQSKLKYSGGKMDWPVPGWYNISSPFGPRLHPIYKTWRNHNGIDIPAYSGTPIVAAASGEVVIAQYSSSYGNYVLLDHGDGYATIYAHCSKLLVTVGQAVARGEAIAKVGTTGWSTGNHLHFGVQVGGEWVDPMEYVGSK